MTDFSKPMVKNSPQYSRIRNIVRIVLVAVVYFCTAGAGFLLASDNDNVTTLLSASGIALAAILLFGKEVTPGILVGAFSYNLLVFISNNDIPLFTVIFSAGIISIGCVFQALLGNYLFTKLAPDKNPFDKTTEVYRFTFIVLFICFITPSIKVVTIELLQIRGNANFSELWISNWFDDVAGIFIITPLILGWAKPNESRVKKMDLPKTILLYSLIFLLGGFIFLDWFPNLFHFKKAYLSLPLLLWAAKSFEQREVVTAIAISSTISILGTVKKFGPFSNEAVGDSFLSSQIYVSIVSITILSLRAATSERNQSELKLKSAHDELTVLAEERKSKLNSTLQEVEDYQKRIEGIFNVLLKYTVLNFSEKAPISHRADEIDAISAGLNTLGEELQFSMSAEKKYSEDLENLNSLLQDSEQQIQTIFDNAPEAVIVMDSSGIIDRWNPTAAAMFGWSANEIIGKPFHDFVIPLNQRETYLKGLSHFLVGRKRQMLNAPFEIEVINNLGNLFTVSLNISPTLMKGRYLFIVFASDVTEIKKAQEALSSSQSFLNSIVENIPNMLFIKDAKELKFIRLNKAGEELLGFTREDLYNKNDYDFFTKEEADFFTSKDRSVLNGGKLLEIPEEFVHTKNKGVRILETKKIPMLDEKGNPQYLLGISNDITERKNMEAELKDKSAELARSNQELEQFAYVASHDLQEPLRMVNSYLQILSKRYKDNLDKDAHDFIAFAVDGSNRMRNLINSLLEYSRINRLKAFEKVDLNVLTKEVLHDLKGRIVESKATITIDELPIVFGDHVLLSQLFLNLIANAIKFKGANQPIIHISFKKQKDEFLFSVKDNGIGIKPQYSEKIFVIFQRLNSKEKYEGTGIGLAICKKIVERHEGKIWIESEIDKGTTFYFTIKENLESPI